MARCDNLSSIRCVGGPSPFISGLFALWDPSCDLFVRWPDLHVRRESMYVAITTSC
jgi:hypothetical protein